MIFLAIYASVILTIILFLILFGGMIGDWRLKKLRRENEALHKQVADLLSGETLPPGVQEKVDAIFEKVNANTKKLSKAITDNTPS